MIKADSNRLLKALVISIMFHAFMFAGMNLLDWFPEPDIPERLAPVVLRIEKTEEEIDLSSTEIVEEDESTLTKAEPKTAAALSDTVFPSVPVKDEFDPYADLRISDDSTLPLTVPFQDEPVVPEADYVPTGGNVIKLEDAEPLDSEEVVLNEALTEKETTPVVSDEDMDDLETALAYDGERKSSSPTDHSDQNRDLYTYNEFPIEFSSPEVNRYLVSEPSISIPSEILSEISSERTVIVGFSLNEEGRLYYLKIKQSSGYPAIDNSIISELRKWEFDKDPGSADVGGTVTIILKGR